MIAHIELDQWARRHVYSLYRSMSQPHVSVTVSVDATELVRWSKASGLSLFATVLHRLTHAANQVPELRHRFRVEDGNDVILVHDQVAPAFTVAGPNGLFNFVSVPLVKDVRHFADTVGQVSESMGEQVQIRPFEGQRDDVIFLSCLRWFEFSQLNHPVHGTDDCIPRIAWGKLVERDGRWSCPINIQVHHSLVDGAHLGHFFEQVQRAFDREE